LLSISILSLASCMFSGDICEDPTLPLPWPCALLDDWSVEWDSSPASTGDIE
jgi:hypothetical protein